jgi:hypothetical protein
VQFPHLTHRYTLHEQTTKSGFPYLSLHPSGVDINHAEGKGGVGLGLYRVFLIPEISGNKLILLYPGAPCQCPRCGWVTLSTNCNAMHSMARHLEIKHSLRLEKAWRCLKCGTIEDGKKIRSHDVKCSQSISQPPASHTSRIPTLLSTTSLSS